MPTRSRPAARTRSSAVWAGAGVATPTRTRIASSSRHGRRATARCRAHARIPTRPSWKLSMNALVSGWLGLPKTALAVPVSTARPPSK